MTVATFSADSERVESGDDRVSKSTSSFSMSLGDEKLSFATTTWQPQQQQQIKALVFVCHGYGEYLSASYDYLAGQLSGRAGLLVFGHDHLGHGRSGGERVQILNSYDSDYAAPCLAHCRQRRQDHPDLPLFIVGHSMGGLITLLTLLQNEDRRLFRGCILMAPLIEVDPSMGTPFNILMARMLSSFLPWVQISGVKKDFVTRDDKERERMREDPLYWSGGIKVKQGYAGLKALESLEARMDRIQLPLFIQQGAEDKVVRPEGAEKLFKAVGSEDKELKMYPEAYHDMYVEFPEVRDVVVQDCLDWLLKRI